MGKMNEILNDRKEDLLQQMASGISRQANLLKEINEKNAELKEQRELFSMITLNFIESNDANGVYGDFLQRSSYGVQTKIEVLETEIAKMKEELHDIEGALEFISEEKQRIDNVFAIKREVTELGNNQKENETKEISGRIILPEGHAMPMPRCVGGPF